MGGCGGLYFAALLALTPAGTQPGYATAVAGSGAEGSDGGPVAAARMDRPQGVALDARGSPYIADSDNHRVRRVDPSRAIATGRRGGVKSTN